jgi:hypothetical protein
MRFDPNADDLSLDVCVTESVYKVVLQRSSPHESVKLFFILGGTRMDVTAFEAVAVQTRDETDAVLVQTRDEMLALDGGVWPSWL